MDYKERLIVEFRELVQRRTLLGKQLEIEEPVDHTESELLKQQYEGMTMYEEALFGRLLKEVRRDYK